MGRESGNLPTANPCSYLLSPNTEHLLLDFMKCRCRKWKGGGADVGIEALPALITYQLGDRAKTGTIYIRGEHKATLV